MKTKIYFIILFISAWLVSCTEEITIELDSTFERIVIEAEITDELKQHQVKITKSADYFSNTPAPPVTGAIVSITDGINTYSLTETTPGIYLTDTIQGVPGNTYTLSANISGEIYEASGYMFTCPVMDSISFTINEWNEDFINVLIYAQEPGNEINHYAWKAFRNNILVTDTLREVTFSDDVFINGSYVNGVEVQYIEALPGDTIILEMLSIEEGYYNFMMKVMSETDWDGGPFDGPPANFYGNISNEALGFFAVYSIQRKTAIIPDDVAKMEY